MNFLESLRNKNKDLYNAKPVGIAFLGDSVTQGCFELYITGKESFQTVFDSENAYHVKLKKMFANIYPNVAINMINAGISGGNASNGLERLERDVLSYHPDLVVVCFGLNDCSEKPEDLEKYKNALAGIFKKLKEVKTEIIFMTPNMMNTTISCHINNEVIIGLAKRFAHYQNEGILDKFINGAKEVCKIENIPICDCYAKWKKLSMQGVDITDLLSNYLNHPTREMHWLFANMLFNTIMFE